MFSLNFFRLLYYSRNSLPVKGAEHITLKKPVCEQLLWWILVWNTLIPKLKNENGFLELLFCNHEIFNTKAVDWRLSDPYQPQPWDKKWAKTHLQTCPSWHSLLLFYFDGICKEFIKECTHQRKKMSVNTTLAVSPLIL